MARAMFDQHKSVFEIFKKTEDINWIINNTEYQGLFLLKQMGRVEEVENKYNSLLEKRGNMGITQKA